MKNEFLFSQGKNVANTAILASNLTMDERKSAFQKRDSDLTVHPNRAIKKLSAPNADSFLQILKDNVT